MSNESTQDPMAFIRQLWSGMNFPLPGMVTPTFDSDELEKRITDLRTVEGWLRMNLSMLQMTIQGLEMQKSTLDAVHAMSKLHSQPQAAATPGGPTVGETMQQAALWPWNMMQQMQDQMQDHLQQQAAQQNAEAAEKAAQAAREAPQQTAAPAQETAQAKREKTAR